MDGPSYEREDSGDKRPPPPPKGFLAEGGVNRIPWQWTNKEINIRRLN